MVLNANRGRVFCHLCSPSPVKMPRFSFLLLLFLTPLFAKAQDAGEGSDYLSTPVERHDFDEKKWNSLKKGLDYTKPPDKEQKKQAEKVKKNKTNWVAGLPAVVKYLLLFVVLAIAVALLVHFAGGRKLFGPHNQKIKTSYQINLEKVEANPVKADLDALIQQTVAARDYRLAVRLYYLAILKELSLKKHIRWKQEKTNGEYLRELDGSPLFIPVQQATLAFERVWYGKVDLNLQDFLLLENQLMATIAEVKQPIIAIR